MAYILSLHVIIVWVSILILPAIHCMPPASPVQCNTTGCTLTNAYGVWGDRKHCNFPQIAYPRTEEDIVSAIASASKSKLKVKVVSKFSHTIPKLACPGSGNSMVISTENYNTTIDINSEKMLVTVDSGVVLRDLIDAISEAGLSLAASPYWEGVSVGGMISTGAHGSSWWGKGGAVHDHVVGMSLVVPGTKKEGYAKVTRLNGQDLLLNAAKLSLGLLGVISKVTLALEKGFKRSITYDFTDDREIEDKFIEHGKTHEFGDITWYPSRHTAVYRNDDRVSSSTPGDGVNDFIGFQSNLILVSKSDRAAEKAFENAGNVNGKCALASTFVGYKKLTANGLKNNILFTGYPVIGHQHKMQTSGSCLYSSPSRIDISCAWDPRISGLFFYETTAIFTVSNFKSFLLDVKKLRDIKPENFCGVDMYNGFLIRFIKESSALLGQSEEDSVVVDFNYYRADNAMSPRLNQDFLEEVEQMAFVKYHAKPHWAKNRAVAFFDVTKKYTKFDMFMAAKEKLDPYNMFSSAWSDAILLGREGDKVDGCALEGQCICLEDRHCSPQNGYFCKAGLVYKQASVCRYSASLVA